MGLFMMKPPKPFKQNSNDKQELMALNRNGAPFNLKFDTLNSSIKGEDKLDTHHIPEDAQIQPSTQRDLNHNGGYEESQTNQEEVNETFDEMYQIPSVNGGIPMYKKKHRGDAEDQRRPFSPPFK